MAKQRKRKPLKTRSVTVPPKPDGARRVERPDVAAAYAHVSKRTLFRLIEEKKIRAYKQSHKVLMVDLDSIDDFHNSLPEFAECQS